MIRPAHYPNTINSGIADAEAFSFDSVGVDGGKIHRPARFPDGSKVIARCGVYGFAGETDTRGIHWASGYLAEDFECERCR